MDTIEKIEKIMKRRGWTKYKLAKASGLPQTTITSLFSGRVKAPSTETLTKIALALGVSASRLLGEDEIPLFEVSVHEKNKLRQKLHDDVTKILALIHEGTINEKTAGLDSLKEKYKNLLGEGSLFDRYLFEELYDEIYDLPVTCKKFSEFSSLLDDLIRLSSYPISDKESREIKESSPPYLTGKELDELPIEEIAQHNLTRNGKPLTEEQKKKLAQIIQSAADLLD